MTPQKQSHLNLFRDPDPDELEPIQESSPIPKSSLPLNSNLDSNLSSSHKSQSQKENVSVCVRLVIVGQLTHFKAFAHH